MAGLIAGAEIMIGGRTPHPYHTRPGMVSQSNDGDPHGKAPASMPSRNGPRATPGSGGTGSRSAHVGTLSHQRGAPTARLREPPWQQNRQIGIPRACTDQARREVKNKRSGAWSASPSVTFRVVAGGGRA